MSYQFFQRIHLAPCLSCTNTLLVKDETCMHKNAKIWNSNLITYTITPMDGLVFSST